MIIGRPIRSEGIKNPYEIKRIHPVILTNLNFFSSFIIKDNRTINEAKYPTYSVAVIPDNSILSD
ncbi:hypothetical protein [Winogradskyella alexanderae]|uniref:hypothetical protein n=1 Tax=Winogradskyella alexanderae TaxID=2877123 RepID=UPI00293D34F1|nr:hypothetical protein [Winogradskyella alexanderae]